MGFIDEIFFWDGSIVRDKFGERKSYSTSKKDDADLVEFIFTSCGYSVNFRCDIREGIKTNYQLKTNKIQQAIHKPLDNPLTPSIILIELIIPTPAKTVRGTPIHQSKSYKPFRERQIVRRHRKTLYR